METLTAVWLWWFDNRAQGEDEAWVRRNMALDWWSESQIEASYQAALARYYEYE